MSAVRSTDYPKTINWRKLVAVIAQIASWFTTLWFVQWIWADGPLPYQALLAVIAEALLVVLKERLFRGDDPALGWAGLLVDGVINAGGILPKACRIVTFPPIAAIGAAFGSVGACTVYSPLSVVLALLGGACSVCTPSALEKLGGAHGPAR